MRNGANAPAALQWLATAEQLRDPGMQGLKIGWQLDPIRNEPQFKTIEARMNFPHYGIDPLCFRAQGTLGNW